MALVTTDRIKEQTDVTGLNDAVLLGNSPGFKTFSSVMNVFDTCYYAIVDPSSGDWETGIGTLASEHLLARTTVNTSSNNNSKVPFDRGYKVISLALTAIQLEKYVPFDTETGSCTINVGTNEAGGTASLTLSNDNFNAFSFMTPNEFGFGFNYPLGLHNVGVASGDPETYTPEDNSYLYRGYADTRYQQTPNVTFTGNFTSQDGKVVTVSNGIIITAV